MIILIHFPAKPFEGMGPSRGKVFFLPINKFLFMGKKIMNFRWLYHPPHAAGELSFFYVKPVTEIAASPHGKSYAEGTDRFRIPLRFPLWLSLPKPSPGPFAKAYEGGPFACISLPKSWALKDSENAKEYENCRKALPSKAFIRLPMRQFFRSRFQQSFARHAESLRKAYRRYLWIGFRRGDAPLKASRVCDSPSLSKGPLWGKDL